MPRRHHRHRSSASLPERGNQLWKPLQDSLRREWSQWVSGADEQDDNDQVANRRDQRRGRR
jgi:hypothetical protein